MGEKEDTYDFTKPKNQDIKADEHGQKTRIERSLFLMTPISPVRKASTPDAPASNSGMSTGLLKSNVSSPRWPEVTISMNVTKNTTKAPMNPVDHLPKGVFGKIVTRMLFIISVSRIHVN